MADTRTGRLARALGIIVALLAWTAAAIGYSRTGEIRWELIAAGAFFGALPFATVGRKKSSAPEDR